MTSMEIASDQKIQGLSNHRMAGGVQQPGQRQPKKQLLADLGE
jgi:hypothetical protein